MIAPRRPPNQITQEPIAPQIIQRQAEQSLTATVCRRNPGVVQQAMLLRNGGALWSSNGRLSRGYYSRAFKGHRPHCCSSFLPLDVGEHVGLADQINPNKYARVNGVLLNEYLRFFRDHHTGSRCGGAISTG